MVSVNLMFSHSTSILIHPFFVLQFHYPNVYLNENVMVWTFCTSLAGIHSKVKVVFQGPLYHYCSGATIGWPVKQKAARKTVCVMWNREQVGRGGQVTGNGRNPKVTAGQGERSRQRIHIV